MSGIWRQKLLQPLACVGCVALWWPSPSRQLGGTEFSGGLITGPILNMFDTATLLFVMALVLNWLLPRVAAVLGLIACALRVPFYFFFIAPGPFRYVTDHLTRAEWSVPLQSTFIWQNWAVLGIVMHGITAWICIRTVRVFQSRAVPGGTPSNTY